MAAETKFYLDEGERYPFYGPSRVSGVAVIVPVDQAARWSQVMSDFEQVQTEMEAAYGEAKVEWERAAHVQQAEADLAAAQMRLARARREQTHRPDNPASWAFIGDGAIPCGGIQYVDEKDARAERMRLHNAWPLITFDIKPYVCVQGHHHLGRSSEVRGG